jgi:hypothetical protein
MPLAKFGLNRHLRRSSKDWSASIPSVCPEIAPSAGHRLPSALRAISPGIVSALQVKSYSHAPKSSAKWPPRRLRSLVQRIRSRVFQLASAPLAALAVCPNAKEVPDSKHRAPFGGSRTLRSGRTSVPHFAVGASRASTASSHQGTSRRSGEAQASLFRLKPLETEDQEDF